MHISIKRRLAVFNRMRTFRFGNADDFPAGSDEAEQMDEIEEVVRLLEDFEQQQLSGARRMSATFAQKSDARKRLRARLDEIVTAARTLKRRYPGIEQIFRIPKNPVDQTLLSLAHTFSLSAPEYAVDLKRRGLDDDFIEQLMAAAVEFQQAFAPPQVALGKKTDATAKLGAAAARGMEARAVLGGIMKLKYKNDPVKLGRWRAVTRIERGAAPPTEKEEDYEEQRRSAGAPASCRP
ncbi:MAG: hypothetical protein JSS81_19780 [Acidobacteria bacterium]|nr:hypothetical protein [Acidobacteriota bacterium]